MIPNSNISYDKDAKNNLETPIYNALRGRYDYYEEYCKWDKNQEFFLDMLNNFPYMIDERVSFLEIFSSIPRMLINHNLIFKNLLNLILKENYHNEDPLLEFWSIFEILSITDVIIICR